MNEKERWSRLAADMGAIIEAHGSNARSPSKAHRKWDCQTPYAIHPLWCATTIATETHLDTQTRLDGFTVLLYHDMLEDTTASLPLHFPNDLRPKIEMMTYESSDVEMEEVWNRPPEIRLYKLYDKVSNLLDGSWMGEERRQRYCDYTRRLRDDVFANYGELNITRIADAVLEGRT